MSMRRYFTDISLEQNELLNARLENLATAPPSPQPGYVYFDTTLLTYRGWDGFIWIEFNTTIPQNLLDFDVVLDDLAGRADQVLFVNAGETGTEFRNLATYLETILPQLNDFAVHSEAYPAQVVSTINHNLNSQSIIYKTYDTSGVEYIPGTFEIVDSNSVRITNDPPISGTISLIALV